MRENEVLIAKLRMLNTDKQLINILEILSKRYNHSLKGLVKNLNEPWKILQVLLELEYSLIKNGNSSIENIANLIAEICDGKEIVGHKSDTVDIVRVGAYVPDLYKQLYEELNITIYNSGRSLYLDIFMNANISLSALVDKYNITKLGNNIHMIKDKDYIIMTDGSTGLKYKLNRDSCIMYWGVGVEYRRLVCSFYDFSENEDVPCRYAINIYI